MIKGLVTLFTSGLFLQPFVLGGVIFGWWCYAYLDSENIWQIYKSFYLYAGIIITSALYTLCFRRVYKQDGDTDWVETGLAFSGNVFKFFAASLLTISFFAMLLMDTQTDDIPEFDDF